MAEDVQLKEAATNNQCGQWGEQKGCYEKEGEEPISPHLKIQIAHQ
jgi:hypothetical protein